jgi:hypothetical protein
MRIEKLPTTRYTSEAKAKEVATAIQADDFGSGWTYTVVPFGAYFEIACADEDGFPLGSL